jgi:translation elongation factor EF-G
VPGVRDFPIEIEHPVTDVQAYLSSAGGVRPYALAAADFEPLPVGEDRTDVLAFVNEVPADELPPRFAAAFGEGAMAQLRQWSYRGVPPYALRIRLRDARWREQESSEAGFGWAGRRAAREAARCIENDARPRAYVRRWPAPRTAVFSPPGHDVAQGWTSPAFHPVRDVHVRLVTASACGVFAIATADFEPLPAGSDLLFEFECELTDSRLPHEYAEAFELGVHETLCAAGRLPTAAVRVRLHDAKWHPVDSNERIFIEAGRRAAAEALRCQTEGGSPVPVDHWPIRGPRPAEA